MKVLKALTSMVSMRNYHLIFLSEITPSYFTLLTNGMLHPFKVRSDSDGLIR
jgi:hypothetical protein